MARCPVCEEVVPAGSNCLVGNSNCFDITGAGEDGDPYIIEANLSADPDQLLTCGGDGLAAVMPAVLSEPPAVQAYNTGDLSIANNTLTTLTLNTELYDTDSMHSSTTNTGRITFTTAGFYVVTLNVAWNKNATGDRMAQIRMDGATVIAYESKDSGGADLIVGHCIAVQKAFTAAQYVEARVQQTSGAALRLLSESYSPLFAAVRVA